jgi:hypothetical protein
VFALIFSHDVKKKKKKPGEKATASSKNRCPMEEKREETKRT